MPITPIVAVAGLPDGQCPEIGHAFLAAGWRVRALLSPGKAEGKLLTTLPPGVTAATASEDDMAALVRALEGVEILAASAPMARRRGQAEAWLAALLGAAAQAGVRRLVLNLGMRPLPGVAHPVFDSLRRMETLALAGPVPASVLRPTPILEELLPDGLPAPEAGLLPYPAPPGQRIAWLTLRTLGEAAVEAATRADAVGRAFDIGGAEPLEGEALAARIGQALGVKLQLAEATAPGEAQAALYRLLPKAPAALEDGAGNAALAIEAESLAEWLARQPARRMTRVA